MSAEQRERLVAALTEAVAVALECEERVISIALEPVEPGDWDERVYRPEIVGRADLLCKRPDY